MRDSVKKREILGTIGRNPMDARMKLHLGLRVEVRSIEDGFQGSWHAGVITSCESGVRKVKYDHLLCDDESGFLTEHVEVSSIVDGEMFSSLEARDNYRGRIRPSPPPVRELVSERINYGLCVDAYYNEAWWEGVVFDMEDGSDNRNVFFPDLGDEMAVKVEDLRITLDWGEVTEEWKPRGKWSFLEIVEEHEMDNTIPVSIKQIWYNVRERKEFDQIGEWPSPVRPLWQELVVDVINNHLMLTVDEFLSSYDFAQSNSAYSQAIVGPLSIGSLMMEVNDEPEKSTKLAIVSQDISTSSGLPTSPDEQMIPLEPKALSIITSDMKMLTENSFYDDYQGLCLGSNVDHVDDSHIDARCKLNWQPAYAKLKIKPEFSPSSIHEYSLSSTKPGSQLTRKVRNHLCYLGWKVDYAMYRKNCRVRYTSPEGKRFYLIRPICEHFEKSLAETSTPMIEDSPERSPDDPDSSYTKINKQHKCRKKSIKKICSNQSIEVEPASCPDAVFEYLKSLKKNFIGHNESDTDKARKHLAAIGWSFWLKMKKGRHDEWRYDSPNAKRTYTSLKSACKAIAKGDELNTNDNSCYGYTEGLKANKEAQQDSFSQKWSRKNIMLKKYRAGGIRKFQMKKNGFVRSVSSLLGSKEETDDDRFTNGLKRKLRRCPIMRLSTNFLSKKRKALGKVNKGSEEKKLTRVLRSSKRVRQAEPSTSSQAPRTVLSWLIDNNAELARTKVYYRRRKDLQPMAEGRITCEGIKCVCCREVFTLGGFEAHAGSNCRQPAANIFLEDGRSLVECQLEVIRQKFESYSHKSPGKAKRKRHQSWNDDICSVCHYGGELILCDHCPSSFHASCLNLQNIPEGDWFCPSCCCGICGENHFDVKTGYLTDKSALCCYQCERRYHARCIRDREMVKLDVYPKENWFCSKTCEKVHWGLQQLLGKPILVGHNNLTWTLIKPLNYEASDHNSCDVVTMAEIYSKLSIALEVMHECFEPVKEPQTQHDLVEDVVFCRSSNLNRINFRGFYTVILERNEELITVATVRVYGNKVAEIPLIGTRFQHRRLGMCRILMNEIEKNLMNLGVKKLVLPAAPSVLDTWTTSFGFSALTQSERSEFLGYTLLDFQETVMCQKVLKKLSSPLSHSLRDMTGSIRFLDLEGNSGISEVFQEDKHERRSETVDQVAQVNATENTRNCNSSSLDRPTPMVTNLTNLDNNNKPCSAVVFTDEQKKKTENNKHDEKLKVYKKKKTVELRSSMSQGDCPKVEVSCR